MGAATPQKNGISARNMVRNRRSARACTPFSPSTMSPATDADGNTNSYNSFVPSRVRRTFTSVARNRKSAPALNTR